MGAITISPVRRHVNLYLSYYPRRAVNRFDVIQFFRNLMRHTFGPIIVVADRGNIHRAREVKEFIEKVGRIQLEHLPAYSPDLNPVEYVWSNLKTARLANYCPRGLPELMMGVTSAGSAISRDRSLIRSFVKGSGLPIRV